MALFKWVVLKICYLLIKLKFKRLCQDFGTASDLSKMGKFTL